MRITTKASLLFFITLVLLSIYTPAFAEVVGKYTFISGRVDVLETGTKTAIPVEMGAPVSIGDIVRTKSNSRAEITFIDDTVVRLAQGTRIEITTYLFDEEGKRKEGILSLFRGKLRSIVPKAISVLPAAFTGGPKFEVHTPTSVTGVRGTDFIVFYLGRSGVVGSLFIEDSGYVFNKMLEGQIVIVREGQTTVVQPGKPPAPPRPATKVEMIKLSNETSLLTVEEPTPEDSPSGPESGESSEASEGGDDTVVASSGTDDEEGDTFGYSPPEEPVIGEEPEPPVIPESDPIDIIDIIEDPGGDTTPPEETVPPVTETEPDLLAPSTVTIELNFPD